MQAVHDAADEGFPGMNEILTHRLRKNLPQSQEDCVAIAVRQSLATYGEIKSAKDRRAACLGIAKGLFGPAFVAADRAQREKWVRMAEEQYRIATKR